jgi:hypothetical protein
MEIERLTSDQTLGLPKNITTSYQAKQLEAMLNAISTKVGTPQRWGR